MPYVSPSARRALNKGEPAQTPGELNYAITRLVTAYLLEKGPSYTTMNDIMGALVGAKAEFYRRAVVPFEDRKRAQNGDVYPDI